MPTTLTERGSDPAASTTQTPQVDAPLQLSARTLDWLVNHPRAGRLVHSVWDKLAELERTGHHRGAIDALRRVLTHHQPTSAGRCHTCHRWTWRRRFPCIVWHQVRGELLGLFASDGGRHRQPALTGGLGAPEQEACPHPSRPTKAGLTG